MWRDGRGDGPPNNWRSAFGGPAWTWDEATAQWYLHLFLPEQPDLDWGNAEVVEAMHDVLRFWLDRGVDGFRADVVHLIGKDETLPDQPEEIAHLDIVGAHEHPRTHELLRGIRAVLDGYPGERVMVGEVPLRPPELLAPYYGADDELHMVFNFALMHVPWSAEAFAGALLEAERALRGVRPMALLGAVESRPASPPLALTGARRRALARLRSCFSRCAGRHSSSPARSSVCSTRTFAAAERVDPGGRDGSRAPIPWDATPRHGWPADPWLPWPPEAERPERRERGCRSALDAGALQAPARDPTQLGRARARELASARFAGGARWPTSVRAAMTFAAWPSTSPIEPVASVLSADGWKVEITTDRERDGQPWDGSLARSEAVILLPG